MHAFLAGYWNPHQVIQLAYDACFEVVQASQGIDNAPACIPHSAFLGFFLNVDAAVSNASELSRPAAP